MAVGVRRFTPSHVTRRFGAFAVLPLRAIGQIRRGEWTGPEAAAHVDQVARSHGLRETGHCDPKLVDMLIAQLRQTKKEERRTYGELEGDLRRTAEHP
jgi:hypothetical protein